MNSFNAANNEKKGKQKEHLNKVSLKRIKSDYFLVKMLSILSRKKLLHIIKYNKQTQNLLDININDYKNYCEIFSPIEIEIIPTKDVYGKFISISHDKSYYHIYFNDSKEEAQNNFITGNDKVEKIKIILDYQIKSLNNLFHECKCIRSITFKKFCRININGMIRMFYGCSFLKEINLSNFNTTEVTNMTQMFYGCSKLKELNLSNFNTHKVTNMSQMFYGCSKLKELNLSNFNTTNVIDLHGFFYGCSKLQKINLSSFNTNNVTDMCIMFFGCSSLKELNLSNFNTNNVTNMMGMHSECSLLKELNLSNFNTYNLSYILSESVNSISIDEYN